MKALIVAALGGLTATATAAPCPPADLFTRIAEITAGTLAFCDSDRRDCWALDVAKGTWSPQPAGSEPTIVVGDSKVTACASDGKDCITVATSKYPEDAHAAINPGRSLLAVWSGGTLDVYDTGSAKRLTTIRGWKSPMGPANEANFRDAMFVGGAIAIWEAWTPVSSAARLFDARTGKRIADVRKAGVEIEDGAVQVDAKAWAFAGWDPRLYVVDVTTGRLRKSIALGGEQGKRRIPGKLADGRVVVVNGGVVLADPATGKASPLTPPGCNK